jgi:hypothetical protein
MGASIIWSYLEQLGADRMLYATAGAIIRNQAAVLDGSRRAFFSPSISDADVAFNKAEALKMPAEYAARLLVDHGTQAWRDVITDLIQTLGRSTLVVGGAIGTLFPRESREWIAAKIPGAKLASRNSPA